MPDLNGRVRGGAAVGGNEEESRRRSEEQEGKEGPSKLHTRVQLRGWPESAAAQSWRRGDPTTPTPRKRVQTEHSQQRVGQRTEGRAVQPLHPPPRWVQRVCVTAARISRQQDCTRVWVLGHTTIHHVHSFPLSLSVLTQEGLRPISSGDRGGSQRSARSARMQLMGGSVVG
jgi:hypothetical protein